MKLNHYVLIPEAAITLVPTQSTSLKSDNNTAVVVDNRDKVYSKLYRKVQNNLNNFQCELNEIELNEVLYVPNIKTNLLQIKKEPEKNYAVTFKSNKCTFTQNDKVCLKES